jgi:hypothetical protein
MLIMSYILIYRFQGLLAKMPDQLVKIMRLPVWQSIMAHFLNDEFASYTGETLVPQKSGYMLATTAAFRLIPGAKPQPLHRVSWRSGRHILDL